MIYNKASEINHNDVFLHLADYVEGSSVYLKLESFNLAGSVKIKAAMAMIAKYENDGLLKKGCSVIESSSGNLGVALAMVCAEKGYRFICVTDINASPHNIALMKAYGAEVVVTEDEDNIGYVKARLKIIENYLQSSEQIVWTDQYTNKENIRVHYETTAPAIHKEFEKLDYLFLGVGSSGTLMGCIKYFRKYQPSVKIIAVDPEGSVLFGGQNKPRFIPGIGGSIKPKIFDESQVDDYVMVAEADALATCNHFAQKNGLLLGGSSGSVLQGIKQYADRIPRGSQIVMISPDLGGNYLATVYNSHWCSTTIKKINHQNNNHELKAVM